MGSKRKPTSPLQSRTSSKIRRINSDCEHDGSRLTPGWYAQPTSQDGLRTSSEATLAPLTKANLRRLEKMTDAGSKSGESVYISEAKDTTTSTPSEGVDSDSHSTTNRKFEATFRANGGLDMFQSEQFPPSNEAEIRAYMDQPRRSPSPTHEHHRRFLQDRSHKGSDRDLENTMRGRLLRDTSMTDELQDIKYRVNLGHPWGAFPKNVGFNNSLPTPKPEWIEGYQQSTFPQFIQQIGGAATLVHNLSTFIGLPHFAAEIKAYGADRRKAEVLAGYNGAHMVFARNRTLEFIGDKDPPRRASPVTVATDGPFWIVYSHYAHWNNDRNMLEYYQNEIASGRTNTYNDFKRSYKVLRNAQDWARQESHDLRSRMQRYEDLRTRRSSSGSRIWTETEEKPPVD